MTAADEAVVGHPHAEREDEREHDPADDADRVDEDQRGDEVGEFSRIRRSRGRRPWRPRSRADAVALERGQPARGRARPAR